MWQIIYCYCFELKLGLAAVIALLHHFSRASWAMRCEFKRTKGTNLNLHCFILPSIHIIASWNHGFKHCSSYSKFVSCKWFCSDCCAFYITCNKLLETIRQIKARIYWYQDVYSIHQPHSHNIITSYMGTTAIVLELKFCLQQ